jgi:hypothetical protein
MKAASITSNEDFGKWKFVINRSTTFHSKPGRMKRSVGPDNCLVAAADSSARTEVVPTAKTRAPSDFALMIESQVSGSIE